MNDMKSIIITIFFLIPIFVCGQGLKTSDNEYCLGFNYSKLTTGDQNGFHIKNEYRRLISRKFNIGCSFGYLHSATESGILSLNVPSRYENNIATGEWGFTDEDGIKILDTKTDQQTYIHTDLTIGYQIFDLSSFSIRINLGGSFAYISNTFITRWELGSFIGESTGEQDLQLVYPYYSRIIDVGICGSININYKISDGFIIGITSGLNNYPKSGYRFYDIVGLKGGLRF